MADVLKRLIGPYLLPAVANQNMYTVPAATTTVVRNIHLVNEGTVTATFNLSIGSETTGLRLFYRIPIAPSDVYDWTGNIVLAATEVLSGVASVAATITLTVSGVESS